MTYHVYVNETHNTAMVHESDCSHCNFAEGTQPNAGNENGYWNGPIQNKQDAFFVALHKAKIISECQHCCGRQTGS